MEPQKFLNYTAANMMGVGEVVGNKIGIELELEGKGVGLPDIATKGWKRTHDGSLRGEAIEYVTTGGKEVDEVKKLVEDLFGKFKKNGVKFNDSIRTSTHVHLNFSDKPLKQAINFFSVFTLLEEILQYYSGEDRKGNLFCMSSRDAEGIVSVLSQCIARGDFHHFAGDRYKYSACNMSSLYKFGTIEVRTMRGANSAEQVNNWVDILNEMYLYSLNHMKSPVDLILNLSLLGADELMREIFSPKSVRELLGTFPAVRTLHYSLMEGARLLQVFAYEFEEAFLADVKVDNRLEGKMAVRDRFGHTLSIWRPEGHRWGCLPLHRGKFWQDGDQIRDCRCITWSAERQRFIVDYGNGDIYECRWVQHPVLDAEPPPLPHEFRALPNPFDQLPFIDEEEPEEDDELEVEVDDWEPDMDDDF